MLPGLACALLFVSPLCSAAPAPVGSIAPLPGTTGAGSSFGASGSSDGVFVAFVSQANNLVTNDDQGPHLDVFLRSLGTSNTVLISVDRSGFGGGNGNSVSPAVQRYGRYVVFESAASNLVEKDANGVSDVFVRDLVTRTTSLVSVDVTGTNGGNGPSTSPLIGEYAIWVVFASQANNLVPNDTNGVCDVFARDLVVRDLVPTTNVCVSSDATAAGPGVGPAESPALMGHYVAFVKRATNATAAGPMSFGEIYVYDLQEGSTTWASAQVASEFSGAASYRCFNPALLAGGRVVAFKATGPGLPIVLFVHDLRSNTTVRVSSNLTNEASWPATSANASFVAYNEPDGIHLWDEAQGSRLLFAASPSETVTCGPPFMSSSGSVAFVVSSNYPGPYPDTTRTTSTLWVYDPGSGLRMASVSTNGTAATVVPWTEAAFAGENVVFESLDEHLVPGDFNQASDVFVRDLSRNTTLLVSQRHADRPPATGVGWCLLSPRSVSAEGRRMVFASFDSDLAERDTNGWPDLFVHDRGTGTNLPVSVDALIVTNPPGGSPGIVLTNPPFRTNSTGRDPAISAEGRFVAFVWRAGFNPQPFGVRDNVYLRDLETGRNEVVNFGYAGIGNASASAPSIGAEGRYVAFHSAATDLVQDPPVSGTFTNVYLFDRLASNSPFSGLLRVQLLSVNRANTGGGSGHSTEPLISPDSRWVLFASTAQDLVTEAIGGRRSLFARDLTRRVTKLVSVGPDGSGQWGYAHGAVFSADSRFVAFVSADSNLVVHDLLAGTSRFVCSNGWNPSLSAEGRLVAYESPAAGPGPRNIFLNDLESGVTTLISSNRAGTGGGNGDSMSPQISYDGQFVAFASKASDLVENDTNGRMDIFVRDRLHHTTLLVTLNRQGTGSANGASSRPVLAPDGHTVVFQSLASDLVAGDYNLRRDVFALSLGAGDSDADGMDDDWEVAYFGDLSHDGTGDTDADGYTDLQEYQAGTDPTNAGSVFRVLNLQFSGPSYSGGHYWNSASLFWAAAPGRSYQVQCKTNLADRAWTSLAKVTANGTTASWKDTHVTPMPRPTRFYRVVLEP